TGKGRPYSVDVYVPEADQLLSCGGSGYPVAAALPLATLAAWQSILPARPLATPSGRTANDVVYDSRRDRFVALGGAFSPADSNAWQFDPVSISPWHPLNAPAVPDPTLYFDRTEHAVYDSTGDRVLFSRSTVARAMPADGRGPVSQIGPEV